MLDVIPSIDAQLLNDFQRNAPIVRRPFARMGEVLVASERDVIDRLGALRDAGRITRFGATVRPNSVAASTLAAVAAPVWDVDRVAATIAAEPGVNHCYMREHHWTLWFVVTGPDRAHVDATLARIAEATGLRVLDLLLVRPFTIDLGFDLNGRDGPRTASPLVNLGPVSPEERHLLQALSAGLPLVPRPFREIAPQVGLCEDAALDRTRALSDQGYLTRFGVIVRHRALGWRANAMVVWQVPPAQIEDAGQALAAVPGVTLCYQRRAVPDVWPYTLYCMIHARSRADALAVLATARRLPALRGVAHDVLFSTRCFRQTGPLIATEGASP